MKNALTLPGELLLISRRAQQKLRRQPERVPQCTYYYTIQLIMSGNLATGSMEARAPATAMHDYAVNNLLR